MEEITIRTQINAPGEKVWRIISEIDNEPAYWKGTTRIRNISKEQNVITRDVFLEGDNRCQQRVILFPKEGVHIKWIKGPITGVKDIMISVLGSATILEVQISYALSGLVGLFSGNATKYLQSEAELALQLIKEESEGIQKRPALEKRKLWADLIHDKKKK